MAQWTPTLATDTTTTTHSGEGGVARSQRGRYAFWVHFPRGRQRARPLEPLEHRGYPVHRHWHRPGNRRPTMAKLTTYVHAFRPPFRNGSRKEKSKLNAGNYGRKGRWDFLPTRVTLSNILNYRRLWKERLFEGKASKGIKICCISRGCFRSVRNYKRSSNSCSLVNRRKNDVSLEEIQWMEQQGGYSRCWTRAELSTPRVMRWLEEQFVESGSPLFSRHAMEAGHRSV